jgi:hypothetical protein
MTQYLISMSFSADDLAIINAAVATPEEKLARLIELPVVDHESRELNNMGDKSEAACRQTAIVIAQSPQILPPSFDLAEARRDLATLDQRRPFSVPIRQLADRIDDTKAALGGGIPSSTLEAYALAKAAGKGAALNAMCESMVLRWSSAQA